MDERITRTIPRRPGLFVFLLGIASFFLLSLGCVSNPQPETLLFTGARGSVQLEQAGGRSYQATHPVSLDATLLSRVLEGIRVRSKSSLTHTLMTERAEYAWVFSKEDQAVLAPYLAKALARATPSQQVRFWVQHPTTYGPATTEAILSVLGRSLYFTLAKYRVLPQKPDAVNMPNRRLPDPAGLRERTVFFVPEGAIRPDLFQPNESMGDPFLTTLVIDYHLLENLPVGFPEPPGVPSPTTSGSRTPNPDTQSHSGQELPVSSTPIQIRPTQEVSPEEFRSIKELVIKKDLELHALKEEILILRRELAEQKAEMEALKKTKGNSARSQR